MKGVAFAGHYTEADLHAEFPRSRYVLVKAGSEYIASLTDDPKGEIGRAGSPGDLAAILRAREPARQP